MSNIDDFPPGLLSRRWFTIDHGRVVVQEDWDIDVPGCPMIRSPWHSGLSKVSRYVRQMIMTEEEFRASGLDSQTTR